MNVIIARDSLYRCLTFIKDFSPKKKTLSGIPYDARHKRIDKYKELPCVKTHYQTTTIHYCRLTEEGVQAIEARNTRGLLGLYGDERAPALS